MPSPSAVAPPGAAEPPLVVDLDGTLLATDSLVESTVQLLGRRPLLALALPWWLLGGKAALKAQVAGRIELDAASLPYDARVLEHLAAHRGTRRLVLCTAADHRLAHAVAGHLGLFDEVIATRDGDNLRGARKARALVERYGAGGFDYAGNDLPDLAVFAAARRAVVVSPTAGLRRRLHRLPNVERVLAAPRPALGPYLRALRPQQWVKNLLVFLPLLATLGSATPGAFARATLAFAAFCLVASSVYLLNDLLDVAADRRHPRKRLRPFAAGTVPLRHGVLLAPVLLAAGVGVAAQVSGLFVAVLLLYYATTCLYSLRLKRVPILDTLVLSGLYTLRVLAGAAAVRVVPSVWLLAFSLFFFLCLALAKRHSELLEMEGAERGGAIPGREYRPGDLAVLLSQGSASGYAAVLVLALYLNSTGAAEYRHPELIWLICPLLLYWINKLWLNSQRREIHDDPLVWAMRNRVSRMIAALCVLLLLVARWLPASCHPLSASP